MEKLKFYTRKFSVFFKVKKEKNTFFGFRSKTKVKSAVLFNTQDPDRDINFGRYKNLLARKKLRIKQF